MTQQQNRKQERDEVLFAFHQACKRPTADDIIGWTERYPEYADDIRAHAAVSRDWAVGEGLAAVEPDETMLARAFSNALNVLYDAEVKASSAPPVQAGPGFHEVLRQRGKEIYQLAKELDIARGILADLFNGWMIGPIRKRLVEAVTSTLGMTRASFDAALESALRSPVLGHAKSDSAPVVKPRPCDEIIRDSNMSDERKRYWLDES